MVTRLWVRALRDFCPESKEEQCFSVTEPLFAVGEVKPSHIRTLQTREDQITSSFSFFVFPWWHEWIHCLTAAQLGIAMAGAVSAIASRAGSRTRCAPPWQRTCVWRCETSPVLCLVTARVWSMGDCDQSRDHGCLYTAMEEHPQDRTQSQRLAGTTLMWSSSITWRETLNTSCIFQQA